MALLIEDAVWEALASLERTSWAHLEAIEGARTSVLAVAGHLAECQRVALASVAAERKCAEATLAKDRQEVGVAALAGSKDAKASLPAVPSHGSNDDDVSLLAVRSYPSSDDDVRQLEAVECEVGSFELQDAATQSGSVIIVNGGALKSKTLGTTEVLDLSTMIFSPGPRLHTARFNRAAVMLDGFRVFVAGGAQEGEYGDKQALDTTEVLDLTKMSCSPGPRMYTRRRGCGAVILDGGRLLLAGGGNGNVDSLRSCEVLTFGTANATMTFSTGPRLAAARRGCAGVLLDAGRALVVGGISTTELDGTEVLSLAGMTFAVGPRMIVPRTACAAVMIDAKRGLVAGGYSGRGVHDTTEVLDVGTMKFSPGPCLGARCHGCTLVTIGAARALVAGGSNDGIPLVTTELLDVATMTFSPGPCMGACRNTGAARPS